MVKKKKTTEIAQAAVPIENSPSIIAEVAKSTDVEPTAAPAGATIKLGGDDVALVLRMTGRSETYLRANGKDREEVSEGELLMMALSYFLGKKEFVEMLKGEYLKIAKGRLINADPQLFNEEEDQHEG